MNPLTATAAPPTATGARVEVLGAAFDRSDEILTPEALQFVAELHRRFGSRRYDRLADRQRRRYEVGNGSDPVFREDTRHIREDADWRVALPAPGLEDRRVEITGPTDPCSSVDALNSGAKVWLADLEDATSPTWRNIIGGQISLYDAVRDQLVCTGADGGTRRVTAERTPTIVMRPRGWHLSERHIRFVDDRGQAGSASGSLFDFGLYAFHNARELVARGRGPYFYIAKIESSEEARLWNDVFAWTEEALGLEHGTIRATVFIETLPAAFEMEEILYVMRDHIAGLNAGRWDYLFSIIKNYRGRGARFVLPDRNEVAMTVPFMKAYTELLVRTCHKRGAFAIGGMSAFVPNTEHPEATAEAEELMRADKRREAYDGFDGTWVAHPGLIPIAQEEFDAVLGERSNQLDRLREDVEVTASQLLDVRIGRGITEAGIRCNITATLRYVEAWLRGQGSVVIDGIVEDASAAEISRSQIWQWIHQDQTTFDGQPITRERVETLLHETLGEVERFAGDRYDDAAQIFTENALGSDFPPFFTVHAYDRYLVEG
ncbi:malate synthase A [Leucobacter sp. gxy201]|uniref:malate synthase A n=1 Tax=Leucobacter sp. gxy201 TaxID=2957200 RepID=UPI003DA0ABE9